jgi:hypothetical protein
VNVPIKAISLDRVPQALVRADPSAGAGVRRLGEDVPVDLPPQGFSDVSTVNSIIRQRYHNAVELVGARWSGASAIEALKARAHDWLPEPQGVAS